MKNRNVGYLISAISLVILVIVVIFNYGLRSIVSTSCSHGSTCPMYNTITIQTYFSLAIGLIILVIGIFFIFSKETEKIVVRKVKEKKKKISPEGLDKNEREVLRILEKENGAIFQKSLMEDLGIGKVGITRLLDKLEAKQIIERKRRGMNNIVVLKK